MSSASYKLISTRDPEEVEEQQSTFQPHRKRSFFGFAKLARIAAVMALAYVGVRFFARTATKLRAPSAPGCHGSQRNLSSLPSHYALPSGDKIPAVALGM